MFNIIIAKETLKYIKVSFRFFYFDIIKNHSHL